MNRYYYAITGNPQCPITWYKTPEQQFILPTNAIEISPDEYENLYAQEQLGKVVILKNNKLIAVERDSLLSEEEKAKRAKRELIAVAKQLLRENDYRWSNAIKLEQYSKDKKQAIIDYYTALVKIINNESNELPILNIEESTS